ncbi:hypothetical protein B5J94_03400 [Moraxella lacunata]|uniref:Uncharacterized protein n=1 Tax=Moraxella lacunata TaxID=477 RepID=A0A1V4H0M7_MORLA|nr:hypothetical protein B5J94_03400 [Moraxella lacunata]
MPAFGIYIHQVFINSTIAPLKISQNQFLTQNFPHFAKKVLSRYKNYAKMARHKTHDIVILF